MKTAYTVTLPIPQEQIEEKIREINTRISVIEEEKRVLVAMRKAIESLCSHLCASGGEYCRYCGVDMS